LIFAVAFHPRLALSLFRGILTWIVQFPSRNLILSTWSQFTR